MQAESCRDPAWRQPMFLADSGEERASAAGQICVLTLAQPVGSIILVRTRELRCLPATKTRAAEHAGHSQHRPAAWIGLVESLGHGNWLDFVAVRVGLLVAADTDVP